MNIGNLGKRGRCGLADYLLVSLERPVLLDAGVTEVIDLIQHRVHEGGAKLLGIGGRLHPKLVGQVFSRPSVVVEGREPVQEVTAALHVPGGGGGREKGGGEKGGGRAVGWGKGRGEVKEGARAVPDEQLLGDLSAGNMLGHEFLQKTVTLLLGKVRVRAELDLLTPFSILPVNPLGRAQLVRLQILAHQLHVSIHGIGDVRMDVLGRAEQLQCWHLVIEQLQTLPHTLPVTRRHLEGAGRHIARVWLRVCS